MDREEELFSNVQMASEFPLSQVQKLQLQTEATRFLTKHGERFKVAQMHVHLKHDGPQLACQLNFVTNGARYHAAATGWNARQIMQHAVNSLDLQVTKHFGKTAHAL